MEAPAAAAAVPWLDLPEGLTEQILERLPFADYIRFAAVCHKWRSIQRHHRRSPLPIPWVCGYPFLEKRAQVLLPMICFSPFDARPNNPNPNPNPNPLPLPKCRSFPLPKAAAFENFTIASSHGWIILLNHPDDLFSRQPIQVLLFDPVSGSHLTLPPVALIGVVSIGCMSYPPTHPDCALIIPCTDGVFLWRVGEPGWTKLPWPIILTTSCPNNLFTSLRRLPQSSVFHGGKFYFLLAIRHLKLNLFVVDTFINTPAVVQLVDMGWSHTPLSDKMWSSGGRMDRLVECNGDLLMVVGTVPHIKGLLVFKADFSRNMWSRVESLGDFALFVSYACSFSLPAADVGVVANNIYFCDSYDNMDAAATLWTAFDLGARRVLQGPPIPHTYSKKYHSMLLNRNNFWFMPRLASVTPTSDQTEPSRATAKGQ